MMEGNVVVKSSPTSEELHQWIVATLPRAVAYAATLLNDRSLAEDLVHDCYCRLLRKADVYDLVRDGRKLLFRSISNACVNQRSRERPLVSLDELAEKTEMPIDAAAPCPEQGAMRQELQEAVAHGLGRLPVLQRAALELAIYGHGQDDIAAMLGIAEGHVRVLVHRARQAMTSHLRRFLKESP